ncbi:MAG TPA: hypothetical protein VKX45_19390 [Bryobacteraceae bacterium]|jgi:hypothetical protein|nr:hypothetical protein [Bryobacteraceae bacterium]
MKRRTMMLLCLLPALAAAQRHGWRHAGWDYQDDETLHRSFTVSGPGRKLIVDNISGYVHVTGGSGGTIEVSVARHTDAESNAALARAKSEVSLEMSQEGGTVTLYEDGPFRHRGDSGNRGYDVKFDYDIQVPADTVLDLKTINAGDIVVKNTTGDYSIHGLNGGIEMDGIAGAGTVHTLNGPVKVRFARNPVKEASFHSLNGAVEVHFQPGLNADLKFHTLNGGVYTDGDVTVGGDGMQQVGRRLTHGRIGSGGPLLSFDTLNGSIKLYTKGM